MKIVDSTFWVIKLSFYPAWIFFTFSLYIFSQIIQLWRSLFSDYIRQIVFYLKQESLLAQTVKLLFDLPSRFWIRIRSWANKINSAKEIHPISFFRTRRNEEQIAEMLERAEANPTDITEDQKVLILMQKMKKLQELVFQQSSDRRKAQSELHEIKNQLTKKNAILIKERSESVQNLQKINLLNSQLREKNQLIAIEKAKVQQLKQEIQNMKKQIENKQQKVQGQDQNEQKEKQPIVQRIVQKVEQKIEQIFQQKQSSTDEIQKNENGQSNQENETKNEQENSDKQNQQQFVDENVNKTKTKKKKKKFA